MSLLGSENPSVLSLHAGQRALHTFVYFFIHFSLNKVRMRIMYLHEATRG